MSPILAAAVTLFPLLFPIWEQRPLLHEDLNPTSYPLHAEPEEIAMQAEALTISSDREVRSQATKHLRQTGTRQAFDILVERLEQEEDPEVLAATLQQLLAFEYESKRMNRALPALLTHPYPPVRMHALALQGRLSEPHFELLKASLHKEEHPLVREAAAGALRRHAPAVDMDFLRTFWTDDSLRVRADAIIGCLHKPQAVKDAAELASAVEVAPDAVRYAVAEHLHVAHEAVRGVLAPTLAEDVHSSIRGATARAIGSVRHDALLPVLLGLASDRDPEVRRQVAENLWVFSTVPSRDVLVALLDDEANLVREHAENSLVSLDPNLSVGPAVAVRIDDESARARYRVYRVLGRIRAAQYDQRILAQLSNTETEADNIASAIFALGLLGLRSAAADVAAHSGHPSPVVREEVARTLGRLLVPSTYDTINELIFDGNDDVRQAAIISGGWTGAGSEFSKTLLQTLKIFSDNRITARNRQAACWAAGRLRPVDQALVDRLARQATTPVIPTPEGPMFEDDVVLVSCAFALAQCARADTAALPSARRVLGQHTRRMTPQEAAHAGVYTLAPSDEVREYARQARAYLEGEAIEPLPRPTRRLFYNYGRYEPPAQ